MSRPAVTSLCATLLLTACATKAQTPPPPPHISAKGHPNLAAAERLTERAKQRVVDAQAANHWDLEGHAAHAKQLLEQAMVELKLSAQASNREHR